MYTTQMRRRNLFSFLPHAVADAQELLWVFTSATWVGFFMQSGQTRNSSQAPFSSTVVHDAVWALACCLAAKLFTPLPLDSLLHLVLIAPSLFLGALLLLLGVVLPLPLKPSGTSSLGVFPIVSNESFGNHSLCVNLQYNHNQILLEIGHLPNIQPNEVFLDFQA